MRTHLDDVHFLLPLDVQAQKLAIMKDLVATIAFVILIVSCIVYVFFFLVCSNLLAF